MQQINGIKLSFCTQSIHDKLESIQIKLSGALSLSHRIQGDEEELQ